MSQFNYVITNPQGIHAHPATLLAKEAKKFDSLCTISKGVHTKKLTQAMPLINMGVRQGDTVTVKAQGADSTAAIVALRALFESHL